MGLLNPAAKRIETKYRNLIRVTDMTARAVTAVRIPSSIGR